MDDTISRQAVLDILDGADPELVPDLINRLPSAETDKDRMIQEIRKRINSPNRGTADYFIVDQMEEIISKYE